MKRREFISLLGGAAAAWPVTALAQQSGRLIRLGVLGPTLNNPASTVPYEAFRTALGEGGFREGQNLTIDYQSVDDPRGPFVVAAELTRSRPDLIVASGPEASLQAVMGVSGFIPVVMIAIPRLHRQPGAAGRQHHRFCLSAIGVGAKAGRATEPGVSRPDSAGHAVRCPICRPVRRRGADCKALESAGAIAAARKSALRLRGCNSPGRIRGCANASRSFQSLLPTV